MKIYSQNFRDLQSFVKQDRASVDGTDIIVDGYIKQNSNTNKIWDEKLESIALTHNYGSSMTWIFDMDFPDSSAVSNGINVFISMLDTVTSVDHFSITLRNYGASGWKFSFGSAEIGGSGAAAYFTPSVATGERCQISVVFVSDRAYFYLNNQYCGTCAGYLAKNKTYSGNGLVLLSHGSAYTGYTNLSKLYSLEVHDIAFSTDDIAKVVAGTMESDIAPNKALYYLPFNKTDLSTDGTAYTVKNYGTQPDLQWGTSAGALKPTMESNGVKFGGNEISMQAGDTLPALGNNWSVVIKPTYADFGGGTETMLCIGTYNSNDYFLVGVASTGVLNLYYNTPTQRVSEANITFEKVQTIGITMKDGRLYLYINGLYYKYYDWTTFGNLNVIDYFLLGGYHVSGGNSGNYSGWLNGVAVYDFPITQRQQEILHNNL